MSKEFRTDFSIFESELDPMRLRRLQTEVMERLELELSRRRRDPIRQIADWSWPLSIASLAGLAVFTLMGWQIQDGLVFRQQAELLAVAATGAQAPDGNELYQWLVTGR